ALVGAEAGGVQVDLTSGRAGARADDQVRAADVASPTQSKGSRQREVARLTSRNHHMSSATARRGEARAEAAVAACRGPGDLTARLVPGDDDALQRKEPGP